MLSAAVHRTSRDVSIMKEKLIFSGRQPCIQAEERTGLSLYPTRAHDVCTHSTCRQGHGMDIQMPTHVEAHTHRGAHSPHAAMLAPWVVGKGDVQEWGGGKNLL